MKPRIAITLGASFLGYATHAGFMARLHELGIRPTHIAGSSAGAITAGLYAAGLPQDRIREVVLSSQLRRSFIRRTKWLFQHLAFPWVKRPAVLDPNGAVDHLESVVGDQRIENVPGPKLTIAHSHLDTQTTHFAQSGPLGRAMAASCCLPIMFAPIEFEGNLCHDGGVAHELPMDMWFDDSEVDIIVAHRVVHPHAKPSNVFPGNMIHWMGMAHETAATQMMTYREQLVAMHGKKLIIADTIHSRPNAMFGWNLQSFYDLGVTTAQRIFDEHFAH